MGTSPSGRARFLQAFATLIDPALEVVARRGEGDYSPDTRAQQFPPLEARSAAPSPRLTLGEIFRLYVEDARPAASTVTTWRSKLERTARYFGAARAVATFEEAEVVEWRSSLRREGLKESTVQSYVVAAKTVCNWAVESKKLPANPFLFLKAAKGSRRRSGTRNRAFEQAEIETILKAATAYAGEPLMPRTMESARRWIPWLQAYTGARPGEICQLRREDVFEYAGAWAARISPEAGTVKDQRERIVPLHAHLIEMGFLGFVQQASGAAPLFYEPISRRAASKPSNIMKPRRPPSVLLRIRLAEWVRLLGVQDPNISPGHAWRHTFKQIALHAGIDKTVRDYICGHAPETEGAAYEALDGERGFRTLTAAMAKFPRYSVNT